MQTHESYIAEIVNFSKSRLTDAERQLIDDAKIVYGSGGGRAGTRGVTYYNKWQNGGGEDCPHSFVEICAFGESDPTQIAGTTLHELAHVIAGYDAGHGPNWKEACARIGLRHARAAGQFHCLANMTPDVRLFVAGLDRPGDGEPLVSRLNGLIPTGGFSISRPRPCGAAIGVRGGTSRGVGSGSRLKKVSCGDCGYIARVTKTWLEKFGPPLCPCNSEPMTEG
jgi:hypothetical protein